MLLPSTHLTAVLLLLFSFVCLGSWPNAFKRTGGRWRFELFYIDFALGAVLVSVLAAVTLGTYGSELSFNDRMAVAGVRSQAIVAAAGFTFNLGNMMLVAAISLAGIALPVALTVGVALALTAIAGIWGGNSVLLSGAGTLVALLSAVTAAGAMRKRELGAPTPKDARARTAKAWILSAFGGVLLGASYPLATIGLWGDLGLGAYAGMLMFAIGMLLSTAFFSVFFMNIAIAGDRLPLRAYWQGVRKQHAWGLAGGAVWGGGMLLLLLAESVPVNVEPAGVLFLAAAYGSALLTVIWGVFAWKEASGRYSRARGLVWLTAVLFLAAVLLTGWRRPVFSVKSDPSETAPVR